MSARVAIVGGGITGLAAAYALHRAAPEAEIVLIERDGRLGGKVQTEDVEGCRIEMGPDSILARKRWAVELIRELGLESRLVAQNPDARGAYVRLGVRLRPIPAGAAGLVPERPSALIRHGLLSPPGFLRFQAERFVPRRETGADESLGDFVRRRFGAELVHNLAEPLLAGIHAGAIDRLSLAATQPQLRELETQHGSLLKAAATRRRAPAKPRPTGPTFVSLRQGLGSLPTALIQALPGVRQRLGVEVRDLRPTPPGYTLALSDGSNLAADAVLLTTPAYVTASLLGTLSPEASRLLNEIPYASVGGAVLGYAISDVPALPPGTGYVVSRREATPVTACTWVHLKWPHTVPAGIALFRLHFGRDGQELPADWSDDDLVSTARAELHDTLGLTAPPAFTRTYRWPNGMPQYLVGHPDRVDRIEHALAQRPGLVVAGSAYRGVGLPDCVRQGCEAAARIAELLKHAETPA